MKILLNRYHYGLVILFLLQACNQDEMSNNSYLPHFEGAPGDVIVVMEDAQWNGTMGGVVKKYLQAFQHGLPFPGEYKFNVIHIKPNDFDNIFQVNRNIIIARIKDLPQYNKPKVEFTKDYWARGQIVVQVMAANPKGFVDAINGNGNKIVDVLSLYERNRLKEFFKSKVNATLKEKLKKAHNLSITVPIDCELAAEKDNFIWLKRYRLHPKGGKQCDIDQDILIYYYDYSDTSMFTLESLMNMRDTIGKRYVPGPSEGSYMATQYADTIQLPEARLLIFNGNYAVEVRGLTMLVNDFRGGPFISLSVHDPKRNRIITVEGMVFAPNFNKREYLRELEAIVYSLEIN